MENYDLEPGKYPEKSNVNHENEIFGSSWSIKVHEDKYILSYISGALQGELKSILVSEEDYLLAKEGKADIDYFLNKYNVC